MEKIYTDLLIIGGGAAGCTAAITAHDSNKNCRIVIMEKGQIERSGCLAAGINAINAYLNPGETPESFLKYVKKEAHGIVRDDLVLSMAAELNEMTRRLESWGLPIYKDEHGNYLARGKRSIKISGESIKPLIAAQIKKRDIKVLNRVVATNYIVDNGRVVGATGFSIREKKFYVIIAKAVICATAGAAGIYGPNSPGSARHKMWYPPFNTGAGFAMGLRAGTEMTSFEMRFIALRIKDTFAPTGTIAQGTRISQINSRGEKYLEKYNGLTTAGRLKAGIIEEEAGRGPCYLDTTVLSSKEAQKLKESYLHMCPGMVLKWADEELEPNQAPLELTGTEPYLVGGHGLAGYWVDVQRRASLPGLYAAGEVAGGAPKKYVTGSMAEGKIAALTALGDIQRLDEQKEIMDKAVQGEYERVFSPLMRGGGIEPSHMEEALQKIMDEYAGGIKEKYRVSQTKLMIASEKLVDLESLTKKLVAKDLHQLMACHEVIDRILIARVLVEHLKYRKETRWPAYQERVDYPEANSDWEIFVNSTYLEKTNSINMYSRELGES